MKKPLSEHVFHWLTIAAVLALAYGLYYAKFKM